MNLNNSKIIIDGKSYILVEDTITENMIKQNSLQENIDKIKDKYEIKSVNGFNVLFKDDMYYGFVSEANIVESENGFNTLSELVDALS